MEDMTAQQEPAETRRPGSTRPDAAHKLTTRQTVTMLQANTSDPRLNRQRLSGANNEMFLGPTGFRRISGSERGSGFKAAVLIGLLLNTVCAFNKQIILIINLLPKQLGINYNLMINYLVLTAWGNTAIKH